MKRFWGSMTLTSVVLAMSPVPSFAGDPVMPECPVMGEAVDFTVSTPTDDGPVYFCCKRCIKKFKANMSKYADKVAGQRKVLANRPKIQVACPVSGESISKDSFVEQNGKKVFFCCDKCVKAFKKSPDKFKAALASSYTYQTKCPVMGEEIDPESFTTLASGQKIYYCCPKCEKALFASPEKYLPKLNAQGFGFDKDSLVRASDHGDHDHGGHGGHGGHGR